MLWLAVLTSPSGQQRLFNLGHHLGEIDGRAAESTGRPFALRPHRHRLPRPDRFLGQFNQMNHVYVDLNCRQSLNRFVGLNPRNHVRHRLALILCQRSHCQLLRLFPRSAIPLPSVSYTNFPLHPRRKVIQILPDPENRAANPNSPQKSPMPADM